MKKEILKFPCNYSIKVFGKNTPDFESSILTIITKYSNQINDNQISKRHSSNGKFIALTVKIIAISRTQIDTINAELQVHSLVKYLL